MCDACGPVPTGQLGRIFLCACLVELWRCLYPLTSWDWEPEYDLVFVQGIWLALAITKPLSGLNFYEVLSEARFMSLVQTEVQGWHFSESFSNSWVIKYLLVSKDTRIFGCPWSSSCRWLWVTQCRYWKLNIGLHQGQHVLLTTVHLSISGCWCLNNCYLTFRNASHP